MRRPWTALLVLSLLHAPRPAAAVIDIVRQQIEVDLTAAPMTITLRLEVVSVNTSSGLTIAAPALPIQRARLGGMEVVVEPHPLYPGQAVILRLPTPLSDQQSGELTIELAGEPSCATQFCRRSAELTYFIPYWGSVIWYAYNLDVMDAYVTQLDVIAPSGHKVAAMGAPAITPAATGQRWSFELGWANDATAFIAGKLDQLDASDGLPASGLFLSRDGWTEVMAEATRVASRAARVYGELWGGLPLERVTVIGLPLTFPWGGVGLLGTVMLNGSFFTPAGRDKIDQAVAHELGHSWWGNMGSAQTTSHELTFLHEAFAEYATWRALGAIAGDDRRTAGMRMNAVWYMYRRPDDQDVAILDPEVRQSPVYVWSVYSKGALVLRMLEQRVGVERFDAALRTHLQAGPQGLTVRGFAEAMRAQAGLDVTAEVQQWLERTGFPRVEVAATITPRDEGVEVTLQGTASDGFDLQLPVVFRMAGGEGVEAVLDLGPGAAPLQQTLGARPAVVEIDPRWTAVREIKPSLAGDVSMDGRIDAADLIEVALNHGGTLPVERRVEGGYDPLYDLDGNRIIDDADLEVTGQLAH